MFTEEQLKEANLVIYELFADKFNWARYYKRLTNEEQEQRLKDAYEVFENCELVEKKKDEK